MGGGGGVKWVRGVVAGGGVWGVHYEVSLCGHINLQEAIQNTWYAVSLAYTCCEEEKYGGFPTAEGEVLTE